MGDQSTLILSSGEPFQKADWREPILKEEPESLDRGLYPDICGLRFQGIACLVAISQGRCSMLFPIGLRIPFPNPPLTFARDLAFFVGPMLNSEYCDLCIHQLRAGEDHFERDNISLSNNALSRLTPERGARTERL